MEIYSKVMRLDGEFFSVKSKDYNDDNDINCGIRSFYKLSENRYK